MRFKGKIGIDFVAKIGYHSAIRLELIRTTEHLTSGLYYARLLCGQLQNAIRMLLLN